MSASVVSYGVVSSVQVGTGHVLSQGRGRRRTATPPAASRPAFCPTPLPIRDFTVPVACLPSAGSAERVTGMTDANGAKGADEEVAAPAVSRRGLLRGGVGLGLGAARSLAGQRLGA